MDLPFRPNDGVSTKPGQLQGVVVLEPGAQLREHRFGVAVPDDLLTTLERVSGRDLQDLWSHWFDETNGEQDFAPGDIIEIG